MNNVSFYINLDLFLKSKIIYTKLFGQRQMSVNLTKDSIVRYSRPIH